MLTQGHVIYDVFIKMDKMDKSEQLSGNNRIERVCQKGFEFPSNETGI